MERGASASPLDAACMCSLQRLACRCSMVRARVRSTLHEYAEHDALSCAATGHPFGARIIWSPARSACVAVISLDMCMFYVPISSRRPGLVVFHRLVRRLVWAGTMLRACILRGAASSVARCAVRSGALAVRAPWNAGRCGDPTCTPPGAAYGIGAERMDKSQDAVK